MWIRVYRSLNPRYIYSERKYVKFGKYIHANMNYYLRKQSLLHEVKGMKYSCPIDPQIELVD